MVGFITTNTGFHSEKGLYYDRNGNLTALKRYGSTGLDDDFTYTYNGNQINTLTDGTTSCAYAYDANGNTKHDGLHNLDIDYNFLNLPWKVQHSKTMKARYSYYADGTKFSVSDVLSGFVYRGSLQYNYRLNKLSLESASFGGGRIYKTSSGYEVRYHVTDHLGSVRATVNQNGVVGDRSDYLPFGLRINADGAATTNRYLYNGKELQVTGTLKYLDYGARFYDPTIGRWSTQDPLAEQRAALSLYNYGQNNPILRIDPDGMLDDEYYNEQGKKIYDTGRGDRTFVIKTQKDIKGASTFDTAKADETEAKISQGILSGAHMDNVVEIVPISTLKQAKSTIRDDGKGSPIAANQREYGGNILNDNSIADVVVGPMRGDSGKLNASVNIPKNPDAKASFHSHPSGTFRLGDELHGSSVHPSKNDYINLSGNQGYIFQMREHLIVIYNNQQVLATLPFSVLQ